MTEPTLTVLADGHCIATFPGDVHACSCGASRGILPQLRHHCIPPGERDTTWEPDDPDEPWACPVCTDLWDWEQDRCHECGRPNPGRWRRRIPPPAGGLAALWRVPRGGIHFPIHGETLPPFTEHEHWPLPAPPRASPLSPEADLTAAAGWCAPTETWYE